MYRDTAAQNGRGTYRVGRFLITRAKSRWYIYGRHSVPHQHFSTLAGAIAWCHQHAQGQLLTAPPEPPRCLFPNEVNQPGAEA
jgi:hypothetical protein